MVALTQKRSWAQYGWFCHGRSHIMVCVSYNIATQKFQMIITCTVKCFYFLLQHLPHLTELRLNVEELSLLPGPIKLDTVGMRWKSLVFLNLRQLLPSVPLTSEPLPGFLYGVQPSIITATNLVDLSERPLPHFLEDIETLFKVGLVRV